MMTTELAMVNFGGELSCTAELLHYVCATLDASEVESEGKPRKEFTCRGENLWVSFCILQLGHARL